MFEISQFRQFIILPTLDKLGMYSKGAEELLVFTCAAESDGGHFLHQVQGPALGIYQCEPDTHNDIWRNFIFANNMIMTRLSMNFSVPNIPQPDRLIYDLRYASAICRLHYYRVKKAIPEADDVDGMYEYYKEFYNTNLGKATKDKSIKAYLKFSKK